MIKLPDLPLPPEIQVGLDKLQKEINKLKKYDQRVAKAKDRFSQRNKKDDTIFKVVRQMLGKMCPGIRRCAYCEDSAADEVEHYQPKDLYPELVFVWLNYLYACGPCNGPKNNQFAVFSTTTGLLVEVTRKKNAPVVPPEPGTPVLIDPRRENPLDFLQLDLLDTFRFLPAGAAGSPQHQRGAYTIQLLRLNERDFLCEARRDAYDAFVTRLESYIQKRDSGASTTNLNKIVRALQRMSHQTVWQEMKRRANVIPELKPLFTQAPEALHW